jgi:hypothetical protein
MAGGERTAVEHGTRFRTGRQQQDRARNLHENGFGRVGVGIGVKDYVVVFVFGNDKALGQFLDSGGFGSA